jgi:Glycosyl hydrolase catalytic core
MESFMSQLYRLGAATLFDAAALHPYAATPDDVLRLVAELRALMRLFGDAGKPIWITEAGWASGGTASALTVDPERLGIVGVVWYSLRDMPGALLARPLRTVSSWTEGPSSPGRR